MIEVAIAGATGTVGCQLALALADHPWFRVTAVSASGKSAGRPFEEFLRRLPAAATEGLDGMSRLVIQDSRDMDPGAVDLVFSALPSSSAGPLEARYARTTPVVSTSSAFREEEDTPLLLGPVNPGHADLLTIQGRGRGWKGFVAPKPNCAVAGLAMTLKPLLDRFGIEEVVVTTLQAVSGAGRSPGVCAMDIIDNVIPYIPGEEAKVEEEPLKILGTLVRDRIRPAAFAISAACTRVPVFDGHLVSASVRTSRPATATDAGSAMDTFGRESTDPSLPSSPSTSIAVTHDPFRPQPRLDRDRDGGMAVTVGRLREDRRADGALKYVALVHNTGLGAAGGAVYTAEHLVKHHLGWRN